MQHITEAPANSKNETQDVVEIKLWGLYLLMNQANLYSEMIESSIDHGPVEKNPQKPGRITFRFKAKEWETKIKKLLYSYRVPVIVKSYFPHQFESSNSQRMMA